MKLPSFIFVALFLAPLGLSAPISNAASDCWPSAQPTVEVAPGVWAGTGSMMDSVRVNAHALTLPPGDHRLVLVGGAEVDITIVQDDGSCTDVCSSAMTVALPETCVLQGGRSVVLVTDCLYYACGYPFGVAAPAAYAFIVA